MADIEMHVSMKVVKIQRQCIHVLLTIFYPHGTWIMEHGSYTVVPNVGFNIQYIHCGHSFEFECI